MIKIHSYHYTVIDGGKIYVRYILPPQVRALPEKVPSSRQKRAVFPLSGTPEVHENSQEVLYVTLDPSLQVVFTETAVVGTSHITPTKVIIVF